MLPAIPIAFLRYLPAIMLCLMACPAVAREQVVLQLRWMHQFQYAGYYAAVHKGYYREAGLDVELREGTPTMDVLPELLAGRAQFGVGGAGIISSYLNGQPVLMLAPILQHSPNVLLTLGSEPKSPHDIVRQGPVGISRWQENAEIRAVFANEGIRPSDVRTLGDVGLEGLISGQLAAYNAYLPNQPYILEQRGIPYSIIRPQTYGVDFYADVLFTTSTYEKRNPETVAAFRRASLRGWEYALSHQDEMIDLILSDYNTQDKTHDQLAYEARVITALISPDMVAPGHSNPWRWQNIAKLYLDLGLATSNRGLENFLYTPTEPKSVDRRIYVYLALALLGLLIAGGVTAYVLRVNRRLQQVALHDELTGLPTRTLFDDRVGQAFEMAKRNGTRIAILFIDLDRFKQINDEHGHAVGDRALREAAARIRRCLRTTDSVCRYGGDEFVVLLAEVGGGDLGPVVTHLQAALAEPLEAQGKTLQMSASIGAAIYPEHGRDPSELARNADKAMYSAKEAGRNTFRLFGGAITAQSA